MPPFKPVVAQVIVPDVIIVGCSLGGLHALQVLLGGLTPSPVSVVLCMHAGASSDTQMLGQLLSRAGPRPVREAREREVIAPGEIYLAPGGYHLLLERERRFALSVDPPVSYARPSIDVLFESAADVYAARAIGVILSGANRDGARGLLTLRRAGGIAVVQTPADAMAAVMPQAALDEAGADHCVTLPDIAPLLNRLCHGTTPADA